MPQKRSAVARAISLPPSSDQSGTWYYKVGRRIEGPHSFKEMRQLASEKLVLKETEVWQEGHEEEKRLAASVMGLIPKKNSKPRDLQAFHKVSQKPAESPYKTPTSSTIQDGPPGGLYLPYLRHSYFWPLPALLAAGAGLFYLILKFELPEEAALPMLSLAVMTIIAALVLALIYLHRSWEMMRVIGSTLAGHKAVTYMAIPLFNAVWSFFALFSWSRSWNYQVQNHPGLSRAATCWPPLFLLFCLAFLASQSLILSHIFSGEWPTDFFSPRHQISLATFAITLILGLGVWAQLCQAINFLARKKS